MNKLAKLRRCISQVHFHKNTLSKMSNKNIATIVKKLCIKKGQVETNLGFKGGEGNLCPNGLWNFFRANKLILKIINNFIRPLFLSKSKLLKKARQ